MDRFTFLVKAANCTFWAKRTNTDEVFYGSLNRRGIKHDTTTVTVDMKLKTGYRSCRVVSREVLDQFLRSKDYQLASFPELLNLADDIDREVDNCRLTSDARLAAQQDQQQAAQASKATSVPRTTPFIVWNDETPLPSQSYAW